MPRTSAARQASAQLLQDSWYPAYPAYPADLLPQLQAWAGPEAIKTRFAAQLAERYQRDRTPYVQRVTELQLLMNLAVFHH